MTGPPSQGLLRCSCAPRCRCVPAHAQQPPCGPCPGACSLPFARPPSPRPAGLCSGVSVSRAPGEPRCSSAEDLGVLGERVLCLGHPQGTGLADLPPLPQVTPSVCKISLSLQLPVRGFCDPTGDRPLLVAKIPGGQGGRAYTCPFLQAAGDSDPAGRAGPRRFQCAGGSPW